MACEPTGNQVVGPGPGGGGLREEEKEKDATGHLPLHSKPLVHARQCSGITTNVNNAP